MKNIRNMIALLLALAMTLSCASALAASEFPFTLTSYLDMEVTFDRVPEKVIAANANAGDQLMAMGLGDKIIATAYNNSLINPLYQEEYN